MIENARYKYFETLIPTKVIEYMVVLIYNPIPIMIYLNSYSTFKRNMKSTLEVNMAVYIKAKQLVIVFQCFIEVSHPFPQI